jgi:hypothetical protein
MAKVGSDMSISRRIGDVRAAIGSKAYAVLTESVYKAALG